MDPNGPEIKVPSEIGWGAFVAGVSFVFAWLGKLELSSRGQKALLRQIDAKLDAQNESSGIWRTHLVGKVDDMADKVEEIQGEVAVVRTDVTVLKAVDEERKHNRGAHI